MFNVFIYVYNSKIDDQYIVLCNKTLIYFDKAISFLFDFNFERLKIVYNSL